VPFKSIPGSPVYGGLHDEAFRTMPAKEKWPYFRRRIWERDRGLCRLCGRPVPLSPEMHVDHVLDRHRGGADHWDNLRIAHADCNRHRRRHAAARQEIRRAPDGTVYTRSVRSVDDVARERLSGP